MKVLVLGYGNPYRGDDGLGPLLAERVAQWLASLGEGAELWVGQQLLPELAEELVNHDVAIFCDASAVPLEDGFLLEELDISSDPEGLTLHSVSPQWLLGLAQSLAGRMPKACLLSVEGESFDFREGLTPRCEERAKAALQRFQIWWKNGNDSAVMI
ncbi:MAG TPA: hydrogenase maturation protease [Thermosynergistes sp.]|nr:hydrogenase maturation protease [Thermosynergistes sp.]